MNGQMIPHLVNVIEKARNALHGISHHQKRTFDPIVEFGQDPIRLGVMRLDGDYVRTAAVVVPVVARLKASQRLDEVPCHAGAAARVGGCVGDLDVGRWGFGPGYFAAAVG